MVTASLAIAARATAQRPPSLPSIRSIGPTLAESKEAFGVVTAIRSLSDGRVIVNDATKHRLVVLDSNLNLISVLADSATGSRRPYGQRLALLPYLAHRARRIAIFRPKNAVRVAARRG